METIEKSIEVKAPISTVYNQWTQFEEFPNFMEGVQEVKQLDDKRLHWKAEIGGKTKEWDSEIVEQVPDQRISWRSTSGVLNSGLVSFEVVDAATTRIALKLNYQPETFGEKVADAMGAISLKVGGDLKHFKEFIEAHGVETGRWRGEISGRQVESTPSEQRLKTAAEISAEPRSKRVRKSV